MHGDRPLRSTHRAGLALAVAVASTALPMGMATAAFHPKNADHEAASPEVLESVLQALEGKGPSADNGPNHGPNHGRYCATPDLLALDRGWTNLSDAQRSRVRRATAPGRMESPGAVEGSGERGGVACFWNLVNSVESEHFSAQWGDSEVVDPGDVDWFLDHLEDARSAFLDAGYGQPLGNPDYKIPVYLGNSGSGSPTINFAGGYATVCDSFSHAYVVLSSFAISSTIDVANHELFHTVQFGSSSPYDIDSYYWESSAVWAEKLAEPDYTAYSSLLPSYTQHTDWPLGLDNEIASPDGFLHKYAMFILPMYIEEFAPEGPDALLSVWSGEGDGLISRLNNFWEDGEIGTGFPEQFGHFTSQVSVMDFDHQSAYLPYGVSPRASLSVGDSHHETNSPGLYGSHYYKLDGAEEGGALSRLRVHFEGPAEWIVAVSRSADKGVLTSTVGVADDKGVATVDGPDPGGLADESWIVVTNPLGDSGDYELSVELLQSEPQDAVGGSGCVGCGGPAGRGHPFEHEAGLMILLLLCPGFLRRRSARTPQ